MMMGAITHSTTPRHMALQHPLMRRRKVGCTSVIAPCRLALNRLVVVPTHSGRPDSRRAATATPNQGAMGGIKREAMEESKRGAMGGIKREAMGENLTIFVRV